MLKLSKWFKGKTKNPELSQTDEIIEVDLSEQAEQEPAELIYGLPSVQEGQVTINNTGVSPADGELLVSFFISNGLSQNVKFANVPLVLIDSEKRVVARQLFDGNSIGEIAGGKAKACVVRFEESNIYEGDIPEDCQVCFDVPAKRTENIEILYQTLPENITEDKRQELERVLANLPPMKHGEVNFSPLHAQITSQSDLIATVIIRNATDKLLTLEQIPLIIFDAQREELARGEFETNDLTIEPYKAVFWAFNFGPVIRAEAIDLSRWHINIAQ